MLRQCVSRHFKRLVKVGMADRAGDVAIGIPNSDNNVDNDIFACTLK